MKKLISISFLSLFFCLYAQEAEVVSGAKTEQASAHSDVVFQNASEDAPFLVLHRAGFFQVFDYKLSDGTNISYSKLNKLLKTVPENKTVLVKKNVWTAIDYAFFAGFCASLAVTYHAVDKGWDDMAYYGAACSVGCFLFAVISGMTAQSYRATAVDNYNLSVMGIPLN